MALRKPTPIRYCKHCGTLLERQRFSRNRLEDLQAFCRRVYCNRACMAAHQDGQIKVLNAKNSRRQSVKQRQTHCSNCGRNDSRLHVHHKDGDPLNNSLSNLVTLCGSCHQLEHTLLSEATPQRLRTCIYCSRPARKRGMCQTHYGRWLEHGDARMVKRSWKLVLVG